MRRVRFVIVVAALVALVPSSQAVAASPTASCPGQELSVLGPSLGRDLGAFIAFEARNPEVEGRPNFGAEVSDFAHGDRGTCPEE